LSPWAGKLTKSVAQNYLWNSWKKNASWTSSRL